MSATGTWIVPTRSVELALDDQRQWRRALAERLADYRRWAVVSRALDDQTAARLAHLERRLGFERMTIAFVGEYSRGKSELINALCFAELGARLLPSGPGRTTLCPTEILWDAARPPGLRLLPIETRESPRALREFLGEDAGWEERPLETPDPETLAEALQTVAQTRAASREEAVRLGFDADAAPVEIPRWRYARLNLRHPLLENGLVILDTPGHNTIGIEPEITLHRLPDAAAIVFMLGTDTGVTRSDQELWNQFIAPITGIEQSCFVVLNKIDGLRDGIKPESQILSEIERQVKATAEALRFPAARIFALSARQGLVAKVQDDREALIKSRLYRLEQALARAMVGQRKLDHAAAVRAESRFAFAASRSVLESRLGYAEEQVEEIGAIQGKNQKLLEALARRAASERTRLEQARAILMGARTIHNREADALASLLDPALAHQAGQQARALVVGSTFSRQIGEALDRFFSQARTRMVEAIAHIQEARAMMESVAGRFGTEFQIAQVEVAPFATDRFLVELDRLQQACERDFKGAGSLLTRRQSTLGALFFDTVALKVVHVFEVADREVRTWMAGFIRPLETQLAEFQEQSNARIEGMGRIRNAEVDLLERLEELKALTVEIRQQLADCERHRQRVAALVEGET